MRDLSKPFVVFGFFTFYQFLGTLLLESFSTRGRRPDNDIGGLVRKLNCSQNETTFPEGFSEEVRLSMSLEAIHSRTKHWGEYFKDIPTHGFDAVTQEEKDFPIAFAVTLHKDVGIFELFLAQFFRPSDSYCIHVDAKASQDVHFAVKQIVDCYQRAFPDSVIINVAEPIPVFWGSGGSILEADWICYRELRKKSLTWKAVANFAGTELPLVSVQTFRERVQKSGGNVMTMRLTNRFSYRQNTRYTDIQ